MMIILTIEGENDGLHVVQHGIGALQHVVVVQGADGQVSGKLLPVTGSKLSVVHVMLYTFQICHT